MADGTTAQNLMYARDRLVSATIDADEHVADVSPLAAESAWTPAWGDLVVLCLGSPESILERLRPALDALEWNQTPPIENRRQQLMTLNSEIVKIETELAALRAEIGEVQTPPPAPTGRKPGEPCPGLAAAIERSGLTATAAAEAADLGRTQIANWIARGRAPKLELEQLAAVLGTTLEQLEEVGLRREALDRLEAAEQSLREAKAAVHEARAAARALGLLAR
jgi:hypothetical protein